MANLTILEAGPNTEPATVYAPRGIRPADPSEPPEADLAPGPRRAFLRTGFPHLLSGQAPTFKIYSFDF